MGSFFLLELTKAEARRGNDARQPWPSCSLAEMVTKQIAKHPQKDIL